jgi:PTH1 family peptidyl-tRNA hydrolase
MPHPSNRGLRPIGVPGRNSVKIVVGLGNPGRQYEHTRHNVGWMVLDMLADRAGIPGRARARDAAATVRGRLREVDLVLVKPTTYMNLSGEAVRKVLARERVPMDDLLIVVDDFALPLGRLRLRREGSAGGHNGLRSIIDEMGTQRFARLRVGIGDPAGRGRDHVLSRFTDAERDDLGLVLEAAADAVEDWAHLGPDRAANRWNAWRLPEPEEPEGPEEPERPERPEQPEELERPEEPAGRAGPAMPAHVREPLPTADGDGIVRTRTGWRKLLPGR